MVSENLEQVKANIEAACKRVGRDPKDVRLVAVSKTGASGGYPMAYDWSSAAKQGKIYRRKS